MPRYKPLNRMGLIGRQMSAIDGVKLPCLDASARQARIDELRGEAQATRDFVARREPSLSGRGRELKSKLTDPDSAKMATGNGVIQGYAAQAAVDSTHQFIVAAEVSGSGSEQNMLLPMIEATAAVRAAHTLITAGAGHHASDNVNALCEAGIPALVADKPMRQRDERCAEQARHTAKGEPRWRHHIRRTGRRPRRTVRHRLGRGQAAPGAGRSWSTSDCCC